METESKQELMKSAALYYTSGCYEMAIEACKKALTIDPIYLRAEHGLARSLASLHRCKEALEAFNWVLTHDGLSNAWYSELYKQRGDVYFEMQDFLNALDDYDRALRLNRKNEEAARMRTLADLKEATLQSRTNDGSEHIHDKIAFPKTKEQWFQEGINHYHAKYYTKSLLACEQAIQLDANHARAYYGKGLSLRRVGNDQEALVAFDQAIQLDAAYMKAYFGIGNILNEHHRYEEALAVYNYAIHLNHTFAAAYSGKGATLFALQRYEEAFAAYDQAIELDPGCVDYYYKKGSDLLDLKREKEAFAVFDQAIRSNPHDFSFYDLIGGFLAYMGHCEKGLAIYDQAIRLNLNIAVAYARKGDIFTSYLDRNDDAVAALEQAALLDPDFTIIKATFLFDIQRYDEAAHAYDQVLQLHPNDISAHYMKGVSLLYSARDEEALASFDQVIQLDPDDMFTHHNRGKALFGCGRHEEALAAFKKTISLFHDTCITKGYFNSTTHYETCWIGDIYAEMTKSFANLEGSEDALEDLKLCYEDICKKIDKAIQAMFGLDENDNDECDDEFTYLEINRNPYSDRDDGEIEDAFELGHDGEWHFYDDPVYDIPIIWD